MRQTARRFERGSTIPSRTGLAPVDTAHSGDKIRNQGRQAGDRSDASFLQGHGAERGAASASCIGLQSRCLPAGRRSAGGDGRPVADRPPAQADQDWRSRRPPRPGRHARAVTFQPAEAAVRRRSVPPHPCGRPTAPCVSGTGQRYRHDGVGDQTRAKAARRVPVRPNSGSGPLRRP